MCRYNLFLFFIISQNEWLTNSIGKSLIIIYIILFLEITPYFYKSYKKSSLFIKVFMIVTLSVFYLSILLYNIHICLFIILFGIIYYVYIYRITNSCVFYSYPIIYIVKNKALLRTTILSSISLALGLILILF